MIFKLQGLFDTEKKLFLWVKYAHNIKFQRIDSDSSPSLVKPVLCNCSEVLHIRSFFIPVQVDDDFAGWHDRVSIEMEPGNIPIIGRPGFRAAPGVCELERLAGT